MELGDWIQYFVEEEDGSRGRPYYYNKETGKTQWEEPEEFKFDKYCKTRGKPLDDSTHIVGEKFNVQTLLSSLPQASLDKCIEQIGVDSSSHLKYNSIQQLWILRNSKLLVERTLIYSYWSR